MICFSSELSPRALRKLPASSEGTQASQHEAQQRAAKNVRVDALNLAGLVSRDAYIIFRRFCNHRRESLVTQTQTHRVLQSL